MNKTVLLTNGSSISVDEKHHKTLVLFMAGNDAKAISGLLHIRWQTALNRLYTLSHLAGVEKAEDLRLVVAPEKKPKSSKKEGRKTVDAAFKEGKPKPEPKKTHRECFPEFYGLSEPERKAILLIADGKQTWECISALGVTPVVFQEIQRNLRERLRLEKLERAAVLNFFFGDVDEQKLKPLEDVLNVKQYNFLQMVLKGLSPQDIENTLQIKSSEQDQFGYKIARKLGVSTMGQVFAKVHGTPQLNLETQKIARKKQLNALRAAMSGHTSNHHELDGPK